MSHDDLAQVLARIPFQEIRAARVLLYLYHNSGKSTKDVAMSLDLSRPCITRFTQFLGECGYITNNRDTLDLRCVKLTITPRGRRQVESWFA